MACRTGGSVAGFGKRDAGPGGWPAGIGGKLAGTDKLPAGIEKPAAGVAGCGAGVGKRGAGLASWPVGINFLPAGPENGLPDNTKCLPDLETGLRGRKVHLPGSKKRLPETGCQWSKGGRTRRMEKCGNFLMQPEKSCARRIGDQHPEGGNSVAGGHRGVAIGGVGDRIRHTIGHGRPIGGSQVRGHLQIIVRRRRLPEQQGEAI